MSGVFTAIGTAVGAYYGNPQAGAAVGAAIDGQFDSNKADQRNQQQIDLANSQEQRRVADLMAAGLNPMLAYNNNPNNSAQSVTSTGGVDPAALGNSALNAIQVGQQVEQSRAQVALLLSQARNVDADTVTKVAGGEVARNTVLENILLARHGARRAGAEANVAVETQNEAISRIRAELAGRLLMNTSYSLEQFRKENEAEFEKKLGTLSPYVRFGINAARAVNGARSAIKE